MTDIFISTKNPNKLREFKRICEPLGFRVLCETDIGKTLPEIEETGNTFEENARIKAVKGCEATGMITVADDSGLCVDALGGAPGVFSARYSGEPCDDARNNALLLRNMENVADGDRTAYFESVIVCVFPDGRSFAVSGKCRGVIARDAAGSGGFGYDRVFISPVGRFSEVSGDKKDSVSHRGRALAEFAEKIKEYI